jgi:hypothetical protein
MPMAQLDVVYPRIREALSTVEAEKAISDREITAFKSFVRRVRDLDATVQAGSSGTGGVMVSATYRGFDPDAIRAAYRDTVLSMPHYEQEYAEPLLEHVENELGPAVGVIIESASPIPPVQRNLVLSAVEDSISRREQFSQLLSNESDSLSEVETRLSDIERHFHQLDSETPAGCRTLKHDLESLLESCEDLAADRQEDIHRRSSPRIAGIGERSLVAYLYGVREHKFPALVEIADVAAQINEALSDVS